MKYTSLIFLLGVFVIIGQACTSDNADKRPSIVVSLPLQQYLIQRIAGDDFNVTILFDSESDPETYEPTMPQLKAISDANKFFAMGNLASEISLMQNIKKNNPSLDIIECDNGITLLTDTHGAAPDPHFWTIPRNLKILSRTIGENLKRLNQTKASQYQKNLDNLLAELDSTDTYIRRRTQPAEGTAFVIWHPSLSYFANEYGIRQLSLEIEGKEVSPREFSYNIDAARKANPKVMFIEKSHDPTKARTVAEEMKLPVVEINLTDTIITTELKRIADAIAQR